MSEQPEELHETIERRLLSPDKVAMLLDNGSLVLMASDMGIQIVLDAAAASHLLDLLSAHKVLLQQSSQEQKEEDQPTAPSLHLVQDKSNERTSNPTREFDLPQKEE